MEAMTNSKNICMHFSWRYNLASRLKTHKGKSPYDFIRAVWTTEPERVILDPNEFTM